MRYAAALVLLVLLALAAFLAAYFNGYFATQINDISFVSIAPAKPGILQCEQACAGWIELRFRSITNLRKLVHDTGADVALMQIGLCPYDDARSVGISEVYHGGVSVSDEPSKVCESIGNKPPQCYMVNDAPAMRAEAKTTNDKGPFVYSAFFPYRAISHFDPALHTIVDEALPRKPQDLCFKVFAPSEELVATPFTSSSIRVPAAEVARVSSTLKARSAWPPGRAGFLPSRRRWH